MARMNKSQGGIYKNGQEPDDLDYWSSQFPIDRLNALEEIRQEYNTWKYGSEPRLQRVYRVIKRKGELTTTKLS